MDVASPLNKDVHSDNKEQSSIRIVVDNSDATVGNKSNAVVGDDGGGDSGDAAGGGDSGDGSGDAAVSDDSGDGSGDAAVDDDVNESGCRSGVDTYKVKMEKKRGRCS